MNNLLWLLQILLGLLFMFSGVVKFMIPAEDMAKDLPPYLSIGFIYFIGVCEILGGIGLIVPWLTKVKPWLTPLAAALLVIIMIGAVAISPFDTKVLIPATVGLLCVLVAYGRYSALKANSTLR
jgi:uncharacterized membrane protein